MTRGVEHEERVNRQVGFVGVESETGSKTDGDRARLIVGEPLNGRMTQTLSARHRGASLCVSDDRAARGERHEEQDDNSGLARQSGGTERGRDAYRST